jgi:hypothetical protein
MACCILGALIMGNLLLWYRRLTGSGPAGEAHHGARSSAAAWRPGLVREAAPKAPPQHLRARRAGLIIATVSLALGGYVALGHGHHFADLGKGRESQTLVELVSASMCRGSSTEPPARVAAEVAAGVRR